MAKKYLFGHKDFKNAYEVDDYPYGFNQRTKLRAWIETVSKKGDRFVTVTLNPKTNKWNKPKASTFTEIGVMYLDEKGHIKWNGVSRYNEPDEVEKFVDEIGGEKNLNSEQKKHYEELTGKNMDDITWTHKFEKRGDKMIMLDIRFDTVNQIKVKDIVSAIDSIISNNRGADNFKQLMDSDGSIRIYGRRGSMIVGPSNARRTYEQFKKFLKNRIKENKEAMLEKNKKFVPATWQKDPNNIKTDKVQFWTSGGTMLTAQMKRADAQKLVKSGKAFVITDQAIGALSESKKKLSVPEKHQLNIAKKTLRMPDAMVGVMGGMDKDDARKFLKKIGYSDREIKKMEENKLNEGKEYALVAIKNNKVVDQFYGVMEKELELAIKMMKKDNPGAKISIEDKGGKVIKVESTIKEPTLNDVNKISLKHGIRLVKGRGYYYWIIDKGANSKLPKDKKIDEDIWHSMYTHSVEVYDVSHLPIKSSSGKLSWELEIKNILDEYEKEKKLRESIFNKNKENKIKLSQLRQMIKEEIQKINEITVTTLLNFNSESNIAIALLDILKNNSGYKKITISAGKDLLSGGNPKNVKIVLSKNLLKLITPAVMKKVYNHKIIQKNPSLVRSFNDITEINKFINAVSQWTSSAILWEFNENPVAFSKELGDSDLIKIANDFSANRGAGKLKTMMGRMK